MAIKCPHVETGAVPASDATPITITIGQPDPLVDQLHWHYLVCTACAIAMHRAQFGIPQPANDPDHSTGQ